MNFNFGGLGQGLGKIANSIGSGFSKVKNTFGNSINTLGNMNKLSFRNVAPNLDNLSFKPLSSPGINTGGFDGNVIQQSDLDRINFPQGGENQENEKKEKSKFQEQLMSDSPYYTSPQLQFSNVDYSWAMQPTQRGNSYYGEY